MLVLRARRGFGDAHLRERHLRHVDERFHAVMLRHRRRVDRGGQVRVGDRHAEVHRLAPGDRAMHRVEVEQVADYDLRAQVAQRLRAMVFIAHHRAHRFSLLEQHLGDGASDAAGAAAGAGDQDRSRHVLSFRRRRRLSP